MGQTITPPGIYFSKYKKAVNFFQDLFTGSDENYTKNHVTESATTT